MPRTRHSRKLCARGRGAAPIRHLALAERAQNYLGQGKKGMARKDLERILAEDSNYEGVREQLSELSGKIGSTAGLPIGPEPRIHARLAARLATEAVVSQAPWRWMAVAYVRAVLRGNARDPHSLKTCVRPSAE